jgi:hypothetical protein
MLILIYAGIAHERLGASPAGILSYHHGKECLVSLSPGWETSPETCKGNRPGIHGAGTRSRRCNSLTSSRKEAHSHWRQCQSALDAGEGGRGGNGRRPSGPNVNALNTQRKGAHPAPPPVTSTSQPASPGIADPPLILGSRWGVSGSTPITGPFSLLLLFHTPSLIADALMPTFRHQQSRNTSPPRPLSRHSLTFLVASCQHSTTSTPTHLFCSPHRRWISTSSP